MSEESSFLEEEEDSLDEFIDGVIDE